MTDDRDYMRDENPHQGASHSFGKNIGRSETTDRERSIESGREGGRPTTPPRQSAPARGAFTLMHRLSEDMNRLFENLGFGRAVSSIADRELWGGSSGETEASWLPQVETFRRGDQLVVRADLPGAKREDVKAEIDNGVLTISGHRSSEREDNRDEFYRSERSYGSFYRAIPLPEGVESDNCEATFKDGVLEVTLPAPRLAERRARQIQIR
jgi:HSP20 family protein